MIYRAGFRNRFKVLEIDSSYVRTKFSIKMSNLKSLLQKVKDIGTALQNRFKNAVPDFYSGVKRI